MYITKQKLAEMFVPIFKQYKEDKEREGFIPTIEMFIEDLEKMAEEDN